MSAADAIRKREEARKPKPVKTRKPKAARVEVPDEQSEVIE